MLYQVYITRYNVNLYIKYTVDSPFHDYNAFLNLFLFS